MPMRLTLFSARDSAAGRELWATDGTEAGTRRLKDLNPGLYDSDPSGFTDLGNGAALFTARDAAGMALWVTDGTEAGTQRIAALGLPPDGMATRTVQLGGGAVMMVWQSPSQGIQLWQSDGTTPGTRRITVPGASPDLKWTDVALLRPGVALLTAVDGVGKQRVFTCSAAGGAPVPADFGLPAGTSVANLVTLGDGRVMFITTAEVYQESGNGGYWVQTTLTQLWVTDGTRAGTKPLSNAFKYVLSSDGYYGGTTVLRPVSLGNGRAAFVTSSSAEDSVVASGELWVTDGTAASTTLLQVGADLSSQFYLSDANLVGPGRLVFDAADDRSSYGRSVWTTDGTVAGTVKLISATPRSSSPILQPNVVVGGQGLFRIDQHNGLPPETWITDGTQAGTRKLDLRAGQPAWPDGYLVPDWTYQAPAAPANGTLVYAGRSASSGTQPWVLDLQAGTGKPLADANDETAGSAPRSLVAVGHGRAVLLADAGGVAALWVTDGTAAGTRRLGGPDGPYNLVAGPVTGGGRQALFETYTALGLEIWATDGTEAGTVRLHGPGQANYNAYPARPPVTLGSGLTLFQSSLLYDGHDLWATDGTAAGTRRVARDSTTDLTDVGPLQAFGPGRALYGKYLTNHVEIWVTNGTAAGTVRLATLPVPYWTLRGPLDYAVLGNTAVFAAPATGDKLEAWVTDGTPGGTHRLVTLPALNGLQAPSAYDQPRASAFTTLGNGKAAFLVTDQYQHQQLWVTDGTAAGTRGVAAMTGLTFDARLVALGGDRVVWLTYDSARVINTATGAATTLDIPGGYRWSWAKLSVLANGTVLAFLPDSIGGSVWATDGTASGTRLLLSGRRSVTYPPRDDPQPILVRGGTAAVFTATDAAGGSEPWITDGTVAGTQRIRDVAPGLTGSDPDGYTDLGNGRVVFTATTLQSGREPWVTDGTAAGTMRLADINTARTGSQPLALAPLVVAAPPGITGFISASGPAALGGVVRAAHLTVTGTTSETAGILRIFDRGTLIATVALAGGDQANAWAADVTLTDGLHRLTATVTVGGRTSAASVAEVTVITGPPIVAVTAVSPDDGARPDDRVVTNGAVTISGTAEPGSAVDLLKGTQRLGQAAAGLDGTWSITPATLSAGTHQFVAQATDVLGNIGRASAYVTVQPPPALDRAVLAAQVDEAGVLDLTALLLCNAHGVGLTVSAAFGAQRGQLRLDPAAHTLAYLSSGADPAHPAETIQYTLRDSQGSTASGSVIVTTRGPAMPTVSSTEAGNAVFASGTGTRLVAGAARQTLVAPGGGNTLFGNADTTVLADGGRNRVTLLPGTHDVVLGGAGNVLTLGDGANTVIAPGTNNRITAGRGNMVAADLGANAVVTLGDGDQVVSARGGRAVVTVGTGRSVIDAGGGHAQVTAAGGDTQVTVGRAGNTVRTGAGHDVIRFAGSGNVIDAGAGDDMLYDTGARNRIVLNSAGQGRDDIYGPVMSNGNVFDLRAALRATAWDGSQATLGDFLGIGVSGHNLTVAIAPGRGAAGSVIAVLHEAQPTTLAAFAAHALLRGG